MSYIYTKKQVLEMQKRPYNEQIQIMDAKILETYTLSKGNVAIAFSGGKDSTFLLHRSCWLWSMTGYKDIPLKVFFNDTTIEYVGMLDFVKNFIKSMELQFKIHIDLEIQRPSNNQTFISIIRKEGLPLVSKRISKTVRKLKDLMKIYDVSYETILFWRNQKESLELVDEIKGRFGGRNEPALFILGYTNRISKFNSPFKIPNKWLPLLDAPFEISDKCCSILKHGNIPERFKSCTIMTGEMAEESEQRMSSYRQTGCTSQVKIGGGGKAKPMGPVTLQTVLRYLYTYNIPIFKAYGKIVENKGLYKTSGMFRTGCALCGFGMAFIPDRYKTYADSEKSRINLAFKPLEEGGLGYKEAFEYCNKHCGTNWYIPNCEKK